MKLNREILIKFKGSDEIKKIIINKTDNMAEKIKWLNRLSEVEYAEPNYLYFASIIPTDSYYNNQWYLTKVKAADAWNVTRESPNLVIAVIDSGVQISHPDLKDNIWRNGKEIADNEIDDDRNGFIDDWTGWDFVNNVADPGPKFSPGYTEDGILHGTIVAGIVAASGNNAAGVSGITWRAKIMPLKVLDDKGEGDTNNVVKAIDYAVANGADIINFSFVGFGYSKTLESAITRAYKAGIIMVAAAGNEQSAGEGYNLDETPMYPACQDGYNGENMVIGVAATDALDQKAIFSSFGQKCVDISAPGVSIFSTTVFSPKNKVNEKFFNKYYDGYWSGTSMATPMVSGAIALVEASNPGLKRDEVIKLLLTQVDNISRLNPKYVDSLGSGRLNIAKAVEAAGFKLAIVETKLIIAPLEQKGAQVKIADSDGALKKEFYAYDASFKNGVNLSSGDVNGDGADEIVTGAGFGGGPQVRIFDAAGNVKGQFFAYAKNFRGGVNVGVGDVNGDGTDEIVTGAGFGGGPQVRIFDAAGNVKGQFFAYAKNFRGGVRVTTANIKGGARENKVEIVTAPGKGGGPHIIIFNDTGQVISQFFAYQEKFTGGVFLSAGDVNADGLDEIITGAGPGGSPHVRVFDNEGTVLNSFYAYEDNFNYGVAVGTIKINR